MHVGKSMRNTRGANQGMSKGALVKKFTILNSFSIVKQGNINKRKRITSSIYINETKNIGFASNVKILTKEEDESNGR